ncbi:MAG: IPExxxVDY family protein [Bacteroidales bacterium]
MKDVLGKKIRLRHDDNFSLLAICAAQVDARMAWLLNQCLRLQFVNQEDIIRKEANEAESVFPIFMSDDSALHRTYTLVVNKKNGYALIKSLDKVDFLLKISPALTTSELDILVQEIRHNAEVTTCFDATKEAVHLENL